MTQEEYKTSFNVLQEQKQEVERKMSELNEEYIRSLPFKVGDCVRFHNKFGKVVIEKAWITKIGMYEYTPDLLIMFVRPKKDGTKSRREERVWWDFNIENVELISENPI